MKIKIIFILFLKILKRIKKKYYLFKNNKKFLTKIYKNS